MRGILDVDMVCLKEIFKSLSLLDLCSTRQSCTQLRDLVNEYCRSLYFAQEIVLDLTAQNIRNVNRILKNFGNSVRHLKISEETRGQNLLLDVIANNCHDVLKGLYLHKIRFYDIDMGRFAGVFDNLEILELSACDGDLKYIQKFMLGHEFAHLTTLKVSLLNDGTEILKTFFMRKRNIKKLCCESVYSNILPLIALSAAEIEELDLLPRDVTNLKSLAQLRKLKRLQIDGYMLGDIEQIALIKELSVKNELVMLGIHFRELTIGLCDALSNLTNLKELLLCGRCTANVTESLEILGQKLSNLESLMLVVCRDFPYRNFLESACKSDKFRKIYITNFQVDEINRFIEQTVQDFIEGKRRRCFVAGDPLCIYVEDRMFQRLVALLTKDNWEAIENYGNIKILRADREVSLNCTFLFNLS